MTRKKLSACSFVQQNRDVIVSRGPGIAQQLTTTTLKLQRRVVAQIVQRDSQRIAPRLVPTSFTTRVTTAIAGPACDTVRTTPRTAFTLQTVIDLHLQLRRIAIEIFTIVCNPESRFLRFDAERVRETQITELEMMPVRLAVGRSVHEI